MSQTEQTKSAKDKKGPQQQNCFEFKSHSHLKASHAVCTIYS